MFSLYNTLYIWANLSCSSYSRVESKKNRMDNVVTTFLRTYTKGQTLKTPPIVTKIHHFRH